MTTNLAGAIERAPLVERSASTAAASPLNVLYEDEALLAVAKPSGMVTHPAYKHPNGTLADAIFARQAARGESRPWLLHRLDRETSGVMLFAKTEAARCALVRQFERRSVQKRYLAITDGLLSPTDGAIEAPLQRDPADRRRVIVDLAGQPSATRYWTLYATETHALILAQPLSGRTHQIRVHLATRGAAILGDDTYALRDHLPSERTTRTMLHAWRLEIAYPGSGASLTIEAPIPADFAEATARLGLSDALAHATATASRQLFSPPAYSHQHPRRQRSLT